MSIFKNLCAAIIGGFIGYSIVFTAISFFPRTKTPKQELNTMTSKVYRYRRDEYSITTYEDGHKKKWLVYSDTIASRSQLVSSDTAHEQLTLIP